MSDNANGNQASSEDIRVFQLNEEDAEFEELEIEEGVNFTDLFQSEAILLFIKQSIFKGWSWHGSKASTRMKFIAAKKAPETRDTISPAIRLSAVDEGEEDIAFLVALGLAENPNEQIEQTGPSYTGSEQDEEALSNMSKDKILLLLEKTKIPAGFVREMIIYNNTIYSVNVTEKEYMGSMVEEKNLVPLQYKVKDGPYYLEGYVPSVLLNYNRVVLIELLRKMSEKELAAFQEKEQKRIEEAKVRAQDAESNRLTFNI